MKSKSNGNKPLHIVLLTVVALAVLTAGVAGLATAETDSDRQIENGTLAPDESTDVDVMITDDQADRVAAFENASYSLQVTDLNETLTNSTGVSNDARTLIFAYNESEWASPQTFDYELTLSENAEPGDLVGVTGDVIGTEDERTTGDSVIVVGDQTIDSTTVDIDLAMTPDKDTEMDATVLIKTPAGETINDEELTYYVDGQEVGKVSNVSVGEDSDDAYRFEMTTPSERTGQVHTVEIGDQRATDPVFVDVPDRRMGDTDGDGDFRVLDVIQANRELLGSEPDETYDSRVANPSRTSLFRVRDVIYLNRMLLGTATPEELTVQDSNLPDGNVSGEFNEVTVTVQNVGDIGMLDGVSLELVDENGESTVVGAEHVDLRGQLNADDGEDTDQLTFNIDATDFESGDYDVVISQETTAPPGLRLEEQVGSVTVE